MEENIQKPDITSEEPITDASSPKKSRWIGIIAIALYICLGGLSDCAWYMWCVIIVLALITFAGTSKWLQLVLGAILLVWGVSYSEDRSHDSDSYYQTESSVSSQTQSAREKQIIEGKIELIRSLQSQFERAERMGAPDYELKRIADEAWAIKQSLEEMNLTHEQRVTISNLFKL